MSDRIPISATIHSTAKLAEEIAKVNAQKAPEPDEQLKKKFRWIECTMKNDTQFPIKYIPGDTYWLQGQYWGKKEPVTVNEFDQMTWYACNNSVNPPDAFVAAGNQFKIVIDPSHTYDFAIGWGIPSDEAALPTAAFKEGAGPEEGYKASKDQTAPITIESTYRWTGVDQDGDKAAFYFKLKAEPGQRAKFTVTEVRE